MGIWSDARNAQGIMYSRFIPTEPGEEAPICDDHGNPLTHCAICGAQYVRTPIAQALADKLVETGAMERHQCYREYVRHNLQAHSQWGEIVAGLGMAPGATPAGPVKTPRRVQEVDL